MNAIRVGLASTVMSPSVLLHVCMANAMGLILVNVNLVGLVPFVVLGFANLVYTASALHLKFVNAFMAMRVQIAINQ